MKNPPDSVLCLRRSVMVLVGSSPDRGADLAIGAESKRRQVASCSQNEAAVGRDPAMLQRFKIPKTQPERVQLLTYDMQAAEAARSGRGGVEGDCWAKFATKFQLGKKMFSWGERRGTLLAEEMERTEFDGLHKVVPDAPLPLLSLLHSLPTTPSQVVEFLKDSVPR